SKLGPLIVPSVCIVVIQLWGWREIFYVFAVPGLVLAVVWMVLVTNSPSENRFCSEAEQRYIADDTPRQGRGATASRRNEVARIPYLDAFNRTRPVAQLETIRQ
ncbi:MFS transporter, partial [Paraburkholderia sp. SIMBA_054]